jgi:hypothetical protein
MDTGFLNRFSRFISREKLAFRKKALLFSFFLALSVIIWLMNALGKNYTSDIDYPVRFKNYPENKTLIGELPASLKLKVSAHGYTLLQHRISSRYIPIVFNVKSFTLSRMPEVDSSFYFLETRFVHDYISKELDSEFEILDVKPDTLIFPFAVVVTKKIPVFADIIYELDKQLILKEMPVLDPDSIIVSGPDYILDTLNLIKTERTELGRIKGSTDKKLEMKALNHVSFSEEKIDIKFTIEKFTEKTLSIPIIVDNLPDSLEMQIFPRKIQLTCQVGLSNFDPLQSGMFSAHVDYNEYVPGITRLKVSLGDQPNFVRAVRFKPKTVEFLIDE